VNAVYRLVRDLAPSSLAAGTVAVLVGFTSSAVIVFQAAKAAGATPEQAGSWMWALGIGMGLTSIGLSLRYRVPLLTAWSTPGAALLITSVAGLPMQEVIGAFVVTGVLILVAGATGVFERLMSRIPVPIASAMLAGVLLRFGLDAFAALGSELALVLTMIGVYLVARLWLPRYAVLVTLAAGLAVAWGEGLMGHLDAPDGLTRPVWVTPHLSLAAVVGVAIPLFLVTMASQNVPGAAILRAHGYDPPISPVVATTGLATTLLAPFGGYALNLAAITAAICMGREAHHDPDRRYTAAVSAGVLYVVVGLFGAAVAGFFAAFPQELVVTIAGLALLGTIGNGLAAALADDRDRDAALITFLVTASGLTLHSVGSAFWGLVAGALVVGLRVLHARATGRVVG
jgi:benzoate membrane transport protein